MSNTIRYISAAAARLGRPFSAIKAKRRAQSARPRSIPVAFKHYPQSRTIGNFEVGQQLASGHFFFAGELLETRKASIWSVSSPNENFTREVHSFVWLDDLAAVGDATSRSLARKWLMEWASIYGKGEGAGWSPSLTGRRISSMCLHGHFIFDGLESYDAQQLYTSIARQLNYINLNWRREDSGLPKLEALAGIIMAGVSFTKRKPQLKMAHKALGVECKHFISPEGSIPSRNPEELMEVFTLLTKVFRTLKDAGIKPDKRLITALKHIAPTLRGLRLGGGSLARFHGGGRGNEGQLDQVLSDSGIRDSRVGELAMGYDRLTAARITVIVDCAQPAQKQASNHAHASTLAFEMSSGRYPMISNCGAGRKFGDEWERVSRVTAAHNTLAIEMTSSSIITKPGFVAKAFGERILQRPQLVCHSRKSDIKGNWLLSSHDGYCRNYGLIHQRHLFLSPDGREFRGQDELLAANEKDQKRFDKVNARNQKLGVNYSLHFHIHPDVSASIDEAGEVVTLQLPNNEEWQFRQEGGHLTLEESIFLDQWRLKPRATKQIVVTGCVLGYSHHTSWIFKRSRDSAPLADIARGRA